MFVAFMVTRAIEVDVLASFQKAGRMRIECALPVFVSKLAGLKL